METIQCRCARTVVLGNAATHFGRAAVLRSEACRCVVFVVVVVGVLVVVGVVFVVVVVGVLVVGVVVVVRCVVSIGNAATHFGRAAVLRSEAMPAKRRFWPK